MIRAVVFDFDGVIANSEPLHFAAFQQVLEGEGISFLEREYYDLYLGYDDLGVFRAVSESQRMHWSPDTLADLIRRKADRLEALERERPPLFDGARDAIERLAADFPLAIASGALKHEIARVLDGGGLTKHFRVIVSAEDTPTSKPAPDPYLRAIRLLSAHLGEPIAAADCVAIEDSRWGLESARSAGLRTIAITHTYDRESLSLADLVITSLDSLTAECVAGLAKKSIQ